MVLAMLGICLAGGLDYDLALPLANLAAGVEIERLGAVTVTREELIHRALLERPDSAGKILQPAQVVERLLEQRLRRKRVVFTNGCFDLLHVGHIEYLSRAKALGDVLVVAVNGDESVRRLKGPDRPIVSACERALVLASLEAVDYVTIFDDDTPMGLLQAIRPDVLVKGGDYTLDQIVGRELVESYGGKVTSISSSSARSTSQIISHILRTG